MNTVSFDLQGKSLTFKAPSSWAEVTPAQLSAWILTMQSDLPDKDKLRLAVPIFFNIKATVYGQLPEHYCIQLAPKLRFLFEENRLDTWLIPTVQLRWFKKYHGPADKLTNITAYEFFAYCEMLYWQYKTRPNEETLNALIAVLYREKRSTIISNDVRVPLTDHGVASRAGTMAKLPLIVKQIIFFNYEGCRNFITATHPKAFSGKGGQSKKRGDVTRAEAGGPLGDLTETRNANIYDFLGHLEDLIEREEKLSQPS
jgi:hypothetical protein